MSNRATTPAPFPSSPPSSSEDPETLANRVGDFSVEPAKELPGAQFIAAIRVVGAKEFPPILSSEADIARSNPLLHRIKADLPTTRSEILPLRSEFLPLRIER